MFGEVFAIYGVSTLIIVLLATYYVAMVHLYLKLSNRDTFEVSGRKDSVDLQIEKSTGICVACNRLFLRAILQITDQINDSTEQIRNF